MSDAKEHSKRIIFVSVSPCMCSSKWNKTNLHEVFSDYNIVHIFDEMHNNYFFNHIVISIEFFLKLHKSDISGIFVQNWHWMVSKSAKIKLPRMHNTNHIWVTILTALPTQPICQSVVVSDFQILIKSCCIEPEMIQVQFKYLLFNKCLGGWVGKAVRILIHRWLVLWVRFPVKATLFWLILKPLNVNFVQKCQKCQICVI